MPYYSINISVAKMSMKHEPRMLELDRLVFCDGTRVELLVCHSAVSTPWFSVVHEGSKPIPAHSTLVRIGKIGEKPAHVQAVNHWEIAPIRID